MNGNFELIFLYFFFAIPKEGGLKEKIKRRIHCSYPGLLFGVAKRIEKCPKEREKKGPFLKFNIFR